MRGDRAHPTAVDRGVHEVEFYGDDAELAVSVGSFLGDGLAAACPAIVVATTAHRTAFRASLGIWAAEGVHHQPGSRLVMVDAAATLQGFLAGDRLDPARFRTAAPALIGRVARPGHPARIYTDMMALLWEAGQVAQALELEELWNGLEADPPFSLLCGYPARLMAQKDEAQAVERVFQLHSGIVSPDPQAAATPAQTADGAKPSEPGAEREFPLEPESARQARHFVTDHLGPRAGQAAVADAALVTAELAANAIMHARSAFTVVVSHPPGRIRISVSDAVPLDAGRPLPAQPGHGLDVVAQLAARWGTQSRPGGKVVWAELPATAG
jgi:MEDS: MEthanogen/methylotroph, DcmR Sensory domain